MALALALAAESVCAQSYPSKPIRLIIPFSAGGPSDVLARLLQPGLSEALGQSVIIDNRVGAGGTIGVGAGASASPDGYTLVQVPSSHAVNAAIYEKLPYDSVRSFTPVILLTSAPYVVAVHPPLPLNSVADLVREAKTKPGQIAYGSGGIGSGSHITGAMFASVAGVGLTHVPYKGLGPTFIDLMAGRIQIVFSPLLPAMPNIRAGKLRAIAVTGAARSKALPELPAVAEALPGFRALSWDGILAPAGTPRDVVAKLNAAFAKSLHAPQIQKAFAEQAIETEGGTPEEFGAFLEAEVSHFGKLAKTLGIRADGQ